MPSKWIRKEKRHRIYARDRFECVYCERHAADLDERLTLDHVMPRVLGGGHEAETLVPACLSCNSAKQDLSVGEFAQRLGDHGIDPKGVCRRVKNATRRKLRR